MLTIEQLKSLNELETLVFDYIATHEKDVLNMKIQELADATHVSTTTILRFCKKAGCNGFSEFKIKYRYYLETPKEKHSIVELSSLFDYFYKVDHADFKKKLENTAKILANKKGIIFVGIGGSGILAKYGAYVFNSYKINCRYYADPYYQICDMDYSQHAVCILSITGNSEELIEKAWKYKEKQAYIITITNREDTALVKFANENYHHYIVKNNEEQWKASTQIPTMFVLETLASKTKEIIDYQNTGVE